MQAKPTNKEIYGFLWSYIAKSRWLLTIAIPLAIIVSATTMAPAPAAGNFFDEILAEGDINKVLFLCTIVFFIFILDGAARFTYRYTIRLALERAVRDLRNDVFERFMIFSKEISTRFTSGQVTNHMLSDMFVISSFSFEIIDIVLQPLTVLVLFSYLFYLNWQLTCFCLLAVPILIVITKFFGKKSKRNQHNIQSTLEKISNQIMESVNGLATIQSYSRIKKFKNEFQDRNSENYHHLAKLIRNEESVSPLLKVFTTLIGVGVAAYGGYLVINGQLSKGDLLAYVLAAGLMQQPLKQIGRLHVRTQEIVAAAERLYKIFQIPLDPISTEQTTLHTGTTTSKLPTPLIEFHNLSYQYPNSNGLPRKALYAVNDLNFSIQPGEKVALVGRSGSGKSTLSQLCMRFMDPTIGDVSLNGKNARDWDLSEFRQHFAYVSQHPFLFNRSIKENLLLANQNATEEELWNALEKAFLKDFVCTLPKQLDTVVGNDAGELSGGERQRLAIARSFLKNAPFLVFDEATSQLDSHSEKAIQQALEELIKNRSAMIIAHRLITIRKVDKIYVFDQGKIVEHGSPASLLENKNGPFHKLWEAQNLNSEAQV